MRVFISHSLKDEKLLKQIAYRIQIWGFEPVFSEQSVCTGTITNKIEELMDSSDFALILYTDYAKQSNFVHQEIGYLKKSHKPIFIIKGNNVQINSGLIYGYDSIELNANGGTDISKLKNALICHNNYIQDKIKNDKLWIMGLAGIGLLALFSSDTEGN